MSNPIEIILLPEADKFIDEMEQPAKKKLFYAIRKTKMRIHGEWFEKLKSSKDIVEFRIRDNHKFFWTFCILG